MSEEPNQSAEAEVRKYKERCECLYESLVQVQIAHQFAINAERQKASVEIKRLVDELQACWAEGDAAIKLNKTLSVDFEGMRAKQRVYSSLVESLRAELAAKRERRNESKPIKVSAKTKAAKRANRGREAQP